MKSSRFWLFLLVAWLLVFAPGCGGGGDDSAADDDDDEAVEDDTPTRNRTATNRNRNTNGAANRQPEPDPEPQGPPPGSVPVNYEPLSIDSGTTLEQLLYDRDMDLATAMVLMMEVHNPRYDIAGAINLINRLARELADDLGEFTTLPVLREKLSYRLFTKNRLRFRSDNSEESRTDPDLLDLLVVLRDREGNCVSLTALVLVVSDRLGLGDYVAAACVPHHTYALVGKRNDRTNDPLILETSQPNATVTHEKLAIEKELSWPLPSRSPFAQRLDRRQFVSCVLNNFALVLDSEGRGEEAISWLQQATSMWRDNVHAHTNLAGMSLHRAERLPDGDRTRRSLLTTAVKSASAALRSWEGDREAYKTLAVGYRLQDRIDESLETLDRAAPHFETDSYELARLRVLAQLRGERGADALETLASMKDTVPGDSDHRCEFEYANAVALILENKPARVGEHLRKALSLASAERIRTILKPVLEAAERNQMWTDGAAWFELFARRAETNDDLIDDVVENGIAFGTHAADVPRGETPTDEQINASVTVLTRVVDLKDSAGVRREIFVILWNANRSDDALPHGLRAAELYEDPDESMPLLLTMAVRFANQRAAGVENLATVVEAIKKQPAEFAVEAKFFGGILAMAREPQTRASLRDALGLFEAYIADGGTNEGAAHYRDQIKDALGD